MIVCKCGKEFDNVKELAVHVALLSPNWPRKLNQDHGRKENESCEIFSVGTCLQVSLSG
jgi:hypothetical protein